LGSNLRTGVERWRCRPDGRQRWLRLALTPADASALRTRARDQGVTVDAWLGIALATQEALSALDRTSCVQRLRSRLAKAPLLHADGRRLRAWQRYLEQCDGPGLDDELPEIVLSADAELPAATDIQMALRLGSAEWDIGRQCELRASALATPLPDYIRALASQQLPA
jgi:hypothetical protein